jgi:hypothetical protein
MRLNWSLLDRSHRFTVFMTIASQRSALLVAIKTAIIVGLILNMINQGNELVSLRLSDINYPKFVLTFLVPFSVSLYSSTSTKLKFVTGELAYVDAKLRCKACRRFEQEVYVGKPVDECPHCRKRTKWKLISLLPSSGKIKSTS